MSFRLARVVNGYQPVHCLPDGLIAWRGNMLYRADFALSHFEPLCSLPIRAAGLARFLGDLEAEGSLPRTVLYNLNPADNALVIAMAGAFSPST